MSFLPATSDIGAVALALSGITGIALWCLKRKSANEEKANEPLEQNRKRKEVIAAEVGRDDERGANVSLDDDLRRLHELKGSGDQPGQAGSPGAGGAVDKPNG